MILFFFLVSMSSNIVSGTRKYIPCLCKFLSRWGSKGKQYIPAFLDVYNKIDSISLEQVNNLARQDHTIVISCEMGLNLDGLLDKIWEVIAIQDWLVDVLGSLIISQELGLVKVYTKKRGEHPDLSDPIVSEIVLSWSGTPISSSVLTKGCHNRRCMQWHSSFISNKFSLRSCLVWLYFLTPSLY